MPINYNHVSRVVIRGEWITVERGSLEVEPFSLIDNNGSPAHPDLGMWAYHFRTDTGDEYYGPLGEIQLFKLANVD